MGIALLAGWALLTVAGGGIDLGRLDGGHGPRDLGLALAVAAALAAAAFLRAPMGWSRVALAAFAGGAGFAAWSAVSIAWAGAPDLAWLSANRAALATAVLVAAAALARTVDDPVARFARGFTLAAGVVLAWALASRVLPELLAPLRDTPRIGAPLGSPNAVGLLAALTVPGAALLLARGGRARTLGTLVLSLAVLVGAMTQSRSGAAAFVVALVLTLAYVPGRARLAAATLTAALTAVPAIAFAFTAGALTREPLLADPATRRDAGLLLGLLAAAAMASAVPLAPALEPPMRRLGRRVRGHAMAAAWGTLAVVVGAAAVLAVFGGRDGAPTGAGRFASVNSNNRSEWWSQAWSAFLDRPVIGHGAGDFPLLYLRYRDPGVPAARQPHQLTLETLAEVGLVGLLVALVAVGATALAVRRLGRTAAPAAIIAGVALLQAQLDWTWTIPATALPAVAAAGVIIGAGEAAGARGRPSALRTGATVAIAAAVAASGVAVWLGTARAQAGMTAAIEERRDDARDAAADARRLNPLALDGLLLAASVDAADGRAAAAAAWARRATERGPDNPYAWECLAAVAASGPVHEAALARLRALDPHRPAAAPLRCRPAW